MDILRKFRYNFHYWLRNCYQAEEMNDYKKENPTGAILDQSINNKAKLDFHTQQPNSDVLKSSVTSVDKINSPVSKEQMAPPNTTTQKVRSDKYMVLQMGQSNNDEQDQQLIQFLS